MCIVPTHNRQKCDAAMLRILKHTLAVLSLLSASSRRRFSRLSPILFTILVTSIQIPNSLFLDARFVCECRFFVVVERIH